MRWGSEDFKFIRPIHWLLASFAGKLVKFELADVKTALSVSGHRFLDSGKMHKVPVSALRGLEAYKTFLRGVGVIVDQEERKALIAAGVKSSITDENTKPLLDAALLEEVTYLVECPDFLVGSFPPAFLKVPNEVLVTSMKKNQKYFPVLDERGHLTNKFVIVTNCKVGANQKTLREGNERIIAARLSDARYFFGEDQKVKLEARVAPLAKIAFHEGLGNLLEKQNRLVELTRNLGKLFGLDEHTIARAVRAAHLCKADLTTQMVFEFPELQGIMGREYALASGEEKSVAQGIFEHYLPRFAGDILPKTLEGVLVALADKFDSLVGCFSLGVIPTGSHDPFGLRRLAQGIVAIVLEKKLDFILEDLIRKNYKLYLKIHQSAQNNKRAVLPEEEVLEKLLQFLAERMKNVLKEEGIRYDLAEAALHEFNDIWAAQKTARALQRHCHAHWFKGLVESADRIHRLAASATRENVLEHDFACDAEKQMFEAYLKVNWETGEKIKKGEYEAALLELAKFTPYVEKFFVDVLVMHEDEKVKTNRLALLKTLEKMYFEFADFSQVVR
jgi:glycyl-tRNA synthetase beta chain